jgi:serine/threonine protein phosphatase 1
MKTFVIGDMHGGYYALLQCIERSKFNLAEDKLIVLGDVADGWPDVAECVEYLIGHVKNLVWVRGNHDQWLLDYLRTEETPSIWITQGGANSFKSYQKYPELKELHRTFLMSTPFYYVDEENRLFVHGGVNTNYPINEQTAEDLMWSRQLWYKFQAEGQCYVPLFKEVYVGHTTIWAASDLPIVSYNTIFMDTGGGWEGKLSMMNIDTKEVFQSDMVSELYPDVRPR